MNTNVIVFTKDRPLQLRAYLESLTFCAGRQIEQNRIFIIANNLKNYEPIIKQFKDCNWLDDRDRGFYETLCFVANSIRYDDEPILFGCDDVIYIRPLSLTPVESILYSNPKVLGFSLRLGDNIYGLRNVQKPIFMWSWYGAVGHLGYVFDLMASVFRNSLLKEILNTYRESIKTPNFLEHFGVKYCIENKRDTLMAMFNTNNYAIAMDVNRVQDDFPNKHGGSDDHSAENLLQKFKEGYVLDWTAAWNATPSDIFTGSYYWKLHKTDKV